MNSDLPIENIFGEQEFEPVNVEKIVPEHYREELLTMRIVQNRASWRTGDIVIAIIEEGHKRGEPLTNAQVCFSVGYYMDMNPRRVANITRVCRMFPPDKREFARPFSTYEVMSQFPLPKARQAIALSAELAKRPEGPPPDLELLKIFRDKEVGEGEILLDEIDKIIARVAALQPKINDTSSIIKIISVLNEIKENIQFGKELD